MKELLKVLEAGFECKDVTPHEAWLARNQWDEVRRLPAETRDATLVAAARAAREKLRHDKALCDAVELAILELKGTK